MLLPDKDNEFDDLIKAAADKYHASGANPDWDQMKGLLDKHMPAKKDRRRWVFIVLILLLGLLAGGYLYFNKVNELVSMSPNGEHKAQSAPGHDSSLLAGKGDVKKLPIPTKTHVLPQEKPGLKTGDKMVSNNETAGNSTIHRNRKPAGRSKIYTSAGEATENDPLAKTGRENAAVTKDESANQTNDPGEPVPATKDMRGTDENKSLNESKPSTAPLITENKLTPASDVAASKKQKQAGETKAHQLEFSFIYAPELTTVGFTHFDKPGSNFGLLIGYSLSKHFTIQTGLIKSKKNYIANGEDFVLDYTMPGNHTLNKVEGYCMMYEIPLNIKSPISTGKTVNFFYTAGISTYIMTSEFYTYTIGTNTGSYDKDMTYSNQHNYWFSVITAGIGAEKKISNRLDFAAFPFIKIPLAGMGEGELKLTGLGINFLLTYKPWSKK